MKIINEKYNDLSKFSSNFKNQKPFPHVILDDFLDKDFFKDLDVEKIEVNKNKGTNFQTDIEFLNVYKCSDTFLIIF